MYLLLILYICALVNMYIYKATEALADSNLKRRKIRKAYFLTSAGLYTLGGPDGGE